MIVYFFLLSAFFSFSNAEEEPGIFEINEASTFRDRLHFGDILLSNDSAELPAVNGTPTHSFAVVRDSGRNRWPKNRVPYVISKKYTSHERNTIQAAIKVLESKSCFKFVKRNKQKDYLFIDKKDGCFSFVGRQGGKQLISLGNGCLSETTIQHELMHALGVEHEHQRPDRDRYIRVMYSNVEPNKRDNFSKVSKNYVQLKGLPYDYKSILHYSSRAFGRVVNNEKLQTMRAKKKGIRLGGGSALSSLDIKKLRILGKCDKKSKRELKKQKKGGKKAKGGGRKGGKKGKGGGKKKGGKKGGRGKGGKKLPKGLQLKF